MNNPPPHWDFFLAHAGPDAPLADELYDRLCPAARTFLDGRSLLLGDDWDRKLLKAQRDSRITVVLVSKNTDQAYYQHEEIANAIAMSREEETEHRVVPVYVDTDAEEVGTPYGLRVKHGIKLSEAGGVDGLAEHLLRLLGQVKTRECAWPAVSDLTENEVAALFILQQIRHALPASVLQEAARIDADQVMGRLGAFVTIERVDCEAAVCPSATQNRGVETSGFERFARPHTRGTHRLRRTA